MIRADARLQKAENAAHIKRLTEQQDMVRCTFSDGRVQDLFIMDALCYTLNMIDLSQINIEEYVEDPAADTEPIIIEVEFLDSDLLKYQIGKDLITFVEQRKEERGYATV